MCEQPILNSNTLGIRCECHHKREIVRDLRGLVVVGNDAEHAIAAEILGLQSIRLDARAIHPYGRSEVNTYATYPMIPAILVCGDGC
jgi:hypothetical protein